MTKIITHGGQAHVDDFLACCLLLYKHPDARIWRREATLAELDHPDIYVVDQGRRWQPELRNFDHHQLSANWIGCAATLILSDILGCESIDYKDEFPEWEYIATFDHQGPSKAGALFGDTEGKHVKYTRSPIVRTLIRKFSEFEELVDDSALLNLMRDIGCAILADMAEREALLEETDRVAYLRHYAGLVILDVSPSECQRLPTESWCRKNGVDADIILAKNFRGAGGYRMIRTKDEAITFQNFHESITFVHATGFLVCFHGVENYLEIINASLRGNSKTRGYRHD